MTVRIGVNPLIWSNDDFRELGGETPLEVCLTEAREAGYEGVELGHKFPRDPQSLRTLLEGHGLALVSGWYGARLLERSAEEEIEAMRPHLELLSALGCSVMVFAETTRGVVGAAGVPLSSRPRIEDGARDAFCGALTRVAEHIQEHGLRLAYHHHMGTVVETEAEIDLLMARTGEAVGLLLDTGHLAFAGGDPEAVARRHGDRIVHVHLKDVRSDAVADHRRRDGSFLDAVRGGVFTVPGDGAIDFEAVLAVLRGHRYDGWLVVEADQDPAHAEPRAYARTGYQHVRAAGRSTALIAGEADASA